MPQQNVGLPPPLVALGGVRVELHCLIAVADGSVGLLKLHIRTGGRGRNGIIRVYRMLERISSLAGTFMSKHGQRLVILPSSLGIQQGRFGVGEDGLCKVLQSLLQLTYQEEGEGRGGEGRGRGGEGRGGEGRGGEGRGGEGRGGEGRGGEGRGGE